MSRTAALWSDWIDALFRPVIAFFCGLVLGYIAKLAAVTTWWFAGGILVVLVLVALFVVLSDRLFSGGIDAIARKLGAGNGIKPSRTPQKRHWFVSYGWLIGLVLGAVAVFILPPEVLEWFV